MKKHIAFHAILLLFFFVVSFASFAQDKKKLQESDTAECLTFTGKLDNTMKSAEGTYTIKIIVDNKVVEQQTVGIKKAFKVVMKKNMFYTLKIEKDGFVPRLFSISTDLPKSIPDGEMFEFNFETNLISQELYFHFDDDDMDFPLALISYGSKCDCFEYNVKYTEKIMSAIMSRILTGA
ncbi:MAG: hypothetical protein ACXVPN_12830 [Bacteroidia bacterium]